MFRNIMRMLAVAAGIALTATAMAAAQTTRPAAQAGMRLWVARYSSPGSANDGAAAVAVSPDGSRVFVTGGSNDNYATVAYSTATGGQLWAARYTARVKDNASAIAVSPDGRSVFVTGTSYTTDGSSACLTKGPMTGHVSGTHITLPAVAPAINGVGKATATYHGTLAAGTLSGSGVVKCSVGVGYGTWKLTRH